MKLKLFSAAISASVLLTASSAATKIVPVLMDNIMMFVPYGQIAQAAASTISDELANTLSYMGNEERLAYDVYNKLYAEWGTTQFANIAGKSEIKHIEAVQRLVQAYKLNDDVDFTNVDLPSLGYMNTPVEEMEAGKYDISKIQELYDALVTQGLASEEDALKVGCTIEVVDIDDLDEKIKLAESEGAEDIVTTFNFLRDGSYRHYWSFDSGLKSLGVSEGCCTWEALCHPEYPQESTGQGSGQGRGRK